MHPCPVRYRFISAAFMGKEQCLRPLVLLSPVFPPVKDVTEQVFFISFQGYFVFLL
jgi:hypothetical protein